MIKKREITGKIALALIICACVAGVAYGQDRVVSEIGLRAGPRGLIFVIDGNSPIQVDVPGAAQERYPELRVKINNARFAAPGRHQFSPPAELPVEDISVSEIAGGIEIVAKTRGLMNGPVDVRGSGNQVRILMTKDPLPEIDWSSAKGILPKGTAEIKSEPVDMKKMEERAVRDAQAPAPANTFSVGQNKQAAAVPAAAPAPTVAAPAAQPRPQQQAQARPAASGAPQIATRGELPNVNEADIKPDGEVTKKTPEGELVKYKVYGRDPFVPLVKDTTTTGLPRIENLRLVGVLEDTRERIALVEDFRNGNRAFALRANDPVEHGKVLRVQRDRVVFLIRDFDVSQSYTLSLSPR